MKVASALPMAALATASLVIQQHTPQAHIDEHKPPLEDKDGTNNAVALELAQYWATHAFDTPQNVYDWLIAYPRATDTPAAVFTVLVDGAHEKNAVSPDQTAAVESSTLKTRKTKSSVKTTATVTITTKDPTGVFTVMAANITPGVTRTRSSTTKSKTKKTKKKKSKSSSTTECTEVFTASGVNVGEQASAFYETAYTISPPPPFNGIATKYIRDSSAGSTKGSLAAGRGAVAVAVTISSIFAVLILW